MCILCVIQKWSRRIATMLPWLVLPLIGLWALSQMLPPAFRFEITSPRLACVFVLLITLFWYEILMPKLSSWRAHRNAQLRERKRNEAIELQKLRKAATRKCRNCLTAYRDQNPGGGKFMCSYCGHVSKRPVLDLPVPPGMGISNSGIIKDLVGKGGKLLNGKAWSENGWICSQEWLDNGNWGSGSFAQKHVNWRRNANGSYGGDDHCLEDKSYSGFVIFACKMLTSFVLVIRWLCRKIFSGGSSSVDDSFNAEHSRISSQSGECVGNFHESRTEKARRKAEEKRQARQEKELLEEEERKQREEVAKLVEERRKLRGEKLEAEKDSEKANSPVKGKDGKKKKEKKRQERRKERDRGSSKSNSDAEELEKRAGKEAEKKLEWDRKVQTNDNIGRGLKNLSSYDVNRGSSGARYLDRMRNNILSSSKAFSGTNLFGRTANTPFVVSKPTSAVNHVHSSTPKKEVGPPERVAGKLPLNGVLSEPQPFPAPKKSWHQLFTRSTSVHPSSTNSVISRPNVMFPSEVNTLNNNQSFGLPSPFPPHNVPDSSSRGFSPTIDPMFPHIVEEPELFEDPCYVPAPVSLLGPVSESLDIFQLNLGSGFLPDFGKEKPCVSKIVGPVSDISRPSPIESPLSKLRGGDKASDDKTWHLWGPSPLGQDGLGLIGGPTWHLNPEWNRLSKDPQRTTTSLFTEDPALNSSTYSPQNGLVNGGQDGGGSFSPICGSTNQDPWLQKAFIPPLSLSLSDDEKKDFTCWSKNEWGAAVEETGESSRNESAGQQEIGDVLCNSAV